MQTSFTLKLTQFNESKKIALIKEIKNLVEGMNLVQVSFVPMFLYIVATMFFFQAKKFVESLPAVVRADIPKEEAEKLKESITAAGGICEIV